LYLTNPGQKQARGKNKSWSQTNFRNKQNTSEAFAHHGLAAESALDGINELLNFRPLLVDFGQMLCAELLIDLEFLLRLVFLPGMNVILFPGG
jgi:hypothetical protein